MSTLPETPSTPDDPLPSPSQMPTEAQSVPGAGATAPASDGASPCPPAGVVAVADPVGDGTETVPSVEATGDAGLTQTVGQGEETGSTVNDTDAPVATVPEEGSIAPAGTAGAATAGRPADLSPAACAELLKQHFPALFGGAPKPMKLRIQADIQQRVPDVFSKHALGAYFRRYTGSTAYLIALGKATQRFDLDGQPAGDLSEEHRVLAREELARRRQITREREQQAHAQQRAEQARLHAQQQAAQAEQWLARQARATLLRDFERTTLTLANFCALKGLTPEALTPQLEAARREAAEAPPPRLHDDRRGPGPRRDPRTEPRREARPEGRQDGRTDARPAGPRPDHRPGARPAGRPGGRPGGR